MAALVAPQSLRLRNTVVTHFNASTASLEVPTEEQDYEYVLDCKTTASKEHMIVALSDKTIQARNRGTMACERQFVAHSDTISEIVVSETQPWSVVSGSNDGTIKMWDLRQSQPAPVQTIRVGSEVWSCSVGCGDTLVVAGAEDRAVFFDLRNGRRLGAYGESHMDNITRVRFHPYRRSEVITASDDGIVCLFDCTIADEDEAIISIINAESSVAQFCIFGPEYHNIACLTGSETLDIWNLTTAQRLAHFSQIRDQCTAHNMQTDYLIDCRYDATNDQLHLATGNHQGNVHLFQLNAAAGAVPEATLAGGHKSAIRCLTWDEDMLVTGGEDARLCQWMAAASSSTHGSRQVIRSSVERDILSVGFHQSPNRFHILQYENPILRNRFVTSVATCDLLCHFGIVTLGRMRLVSFLVVAAASAVHALRTTSSTVIVVGAKASASGAPLSTHSNDCADCDFRLVKIPPVQYSTTSSSLTRDVFLFSPQFPRHVGTSRSPSYNETAWPQSVPIAKIPQIRETYGYFEGIHGIVNEHQLAFGQSTCGARLSSRPLSQGGRAALDITELTRIALERTTTARDAIALMGRLAETYGFYGAYWDDEDPFATAGDALAVTDRKEGWIFHILPDDTGVSAVWVAQRVPDSNVAVVANQFIIHKVNLTDSDNFIGSTNMYDVATRNGFWDGQLDFDFTAAFAKPVAWHYASTRRVWRVLSLASPSLQLSPEADMFAITYPFSVVADGAPLGAVDLMGILRDHYENTDYDLTQGAAAGPFGDPDRNDVSDNDMVHFESAISRPGSYSYVSVLDPKADFNAVLWFGPYAAHATAYVPVYAKASNPPEVLSRGSLRQFDITSSFWLNALIGNYAARWYENVHPVVAVDRASIEANAMDAQETIRSAALEVKTKVGETALVQFLTQTSESFANDAQAASMNLLSDIITHFHDGFIMSNLDQDVISADSMGYPAWWLSSVSPEDSGDFDSSSSSDEGTDTAGDFDAPSTDVPTADTATVSPSSDPTTASPVGTKQGDVTGASNTNDNTTSTTTGDSPNLDDCPQPSGSWGAAVLFLFAVLLVGSAALGYYIGKRQAIRNRGYAYIQ
ncbi:hypothetical protein LEN26_021343 [Aphanomyces euteiches]|nr:hypothetical protein LEN26_021343 [Aphanomyces euteiches]